ncbi:MAG: sulfotransferase domain-containing protein [Spongiibacteraceae bacterium]
MDLMYPLEGKYEPDYGQNLYVHDGVAFPMCNSAALMAAIENFPCDPRDVTIVGFPKSGTNWVQAMVQKLYDDDWGTLKIADVVPHIDIGTYAGVIGFEYCVAAPHPRLMKSHSQYRHMPKVFREQKIGKAIYVARNPKDVCDSFYNQLDSLRAQQEFTLDWPQWVEHFISGHVSYGPWLEHVSEWQQHAEDANVLYLRYEDMKINAHATLERVVEFLDRPVAMGKIDAVIAQTEFSKMQQGEGAKLYNGPVARREGKAGGWRKHFTVAQNELFDQEIVSKLQARGIDFHYG